MKLKNIASIGAGALVALPLHLGSSQISPASAAPPPIVEEAPGKALPKTTSDVLRLFRAGVGEEVILAYVKAAPPLYNLSVTDVLHLTEAGLPSPVLAAMLNHDNALRNSEQPGQPAAVPTPADLATFAPQSLDDAPIRVYAEPSLTPQAVEMGSGPPGPDYYRGPGYAGWNGGRVWMASGWRSRAGYDTTRPQDAWTRSHANRTGHSARNYTNVTRHDSTGPGR